MALQLVSCVREFLPEVDEYRNLMVVEGLITDELKQHYVTLSRSAAVGQIGEGAPVSAATVIVTDNMQNQYFFNEQEPGYYTTDSMRFQPGSIYSLRVITGDDSYVSTPMELRATHPIDTVFSELQSLPVQGSNLMKLGYQVYFNSYDPTNSTKFYRWEYFETWETKYPRNFLLPWVVNNNCWVEDRSYRIYLENTTPKQEAIFENYPLVFIGTETPRLGVRYSLLLKQYAISEEEYWYWENLRDLNQEVGGLYDPIPSALPGNMKSENHPEMDVLGFFSVSGASSKRVFIQNDTIPKPNYYYYCLTDTVPNLNGISGIGTDIFIVERTDPPTVVYLISPYRACVDCTVFGTNIKPSYWEDEAK
jgi:hypothetical protein